MEHLKFIPITIFLIVFATCLVYAVINWFQVVRHLFTMTKHYKAGINKWGKETWYNPFNGIWHQHLLTEVGVEHAKKCSSAVLKFVIAVVLPFIVGYFVELITGVKFVSVW